MKSSAFFPLLAAGGLMFAAAASAQTRQPPTDPGSGLPFCSAQVKDRCIQRSDLRRQGKPAATKAAQTTP